MSADEYKQKGNDAFRQKDFPEAIEYFTKAIEASDAPNHVLYSNRSACHTVGAAEFGLAKYDEAASAYSKALELDPSNAMAKDGLQSAKEAQTSSDPGMGMNDMFSKFTDPQLINKLKVNPKTADLMRDPALVEKVKKMQNNPQAVAADMMSDPRLMTVITTILGIDLSQPPNGGAGEPAPAAPAADEDVKMEDAAPAAEKATPAPAKKEAPAQPKEKVSSEKETADKFKAEANQLYKAKKFDDAIELYNKAWETFKDITYLNNRAAAEYEKGEYDVAIETCKQAIEDGREMRANYTVIAKSFARLGTCYLKKDDLKTAIGFFEKSLTEHRTADTLTKLRNAEKELKKRESESYIDKDKAEEARLEGKDYFTKGDWPNAVKAYAEMIKRDPSDVRGYSNRAAALAKLMSFPDAIRDCDQAIKVDPTFIRAYIRKATAQMAMKEYKGCIDTLNDAKDVETKNGNNPAQLREIEQLLQKALGQRFAPLEGETYEQSVARFQQDPEVVEILQDPVMNTILQQAQGNPAALQEHMKNPEVYKKILILMAAGIIRTR
ncbi:hypothetical protein PMKS-001018 [Pichia membranifaciens]|uniref:STI1 domain-containing protein n=1 Tax=Pichia membranifaciens TaxID=4926 RepID=A0A1Q2YDD2_9ASCO|nr:hypothetical protein PMKS-001018 [Pichia membranifaciens]